MTVATEFFEHINFGGNVSRFVTPTDWRWQWVKFGSALANKISSLRSNVVEGRPANVYAFTNNDFTGNFASLDVNSGWTSWWSAVGSLNDDIESALIIRRDSREIVTQLKNLLIPDFRTEFDAEAAGTQARRNGDPFVYAVYVAPHDPNSMMVRIHQNITVVLDCWPDYDAWVQFDLKFTLSGNPLDAFCAWVTTWVESGVHSGTIFDRLHPRMVQAAGVLTQKLRQKTAIINAQVNAAGIRFWDIYILPGQQPAFPPPDANFGRFGNSAEDCCLVLVRSN